MSFDLEAKLKFLAERRVATDDPDFCAYDWCGGNVDDAVGIGERCGETDLARELCRKLGIVYVIEEDDE